MFQKNVFLWEKKGMREKNVFIGLGVAIAVALILFIGARCISPVCRSTSNGGNDTDSYKQPLHNVSHDWRYEYFDYIKQNIDTFAYKTFTLCYVDNDTIPEVCLIGSCYADGAILLSQYNGVVSALECYWSPQYIEKKGLICDGYAHGGTYGNNIYSLQYGTFQTIVETKAVWNWQDSFLFYLNGEVVDSIHGNNVEDSCIVIQEQLNNVYYSKGESKSISENNIQPTKRFLLSSSQN